MVEGDSPAAKDKLFVHCSQDSREHSQGPTPSLFRFDKRLKISQRNVDLGRDQLVVAEILNLSSSERWSIQKNLYYIAYNCGEVLKLYLSEDFSGVKREKEVVENQGDVFRLKFMKKNCVYFAIYKITQRAGYDCRKCESRCQVLKPFNYEKPVPTLFGVDGTQFFARRRSFDYENENCFSLMGKFFQQSQHTTGWSELEKPKKFPFLT